MENKVEEVTSRRVKKSHFGLFYPFLFHLLRLLPVS